MFNARQNNNGIPTIRMITCPACNKNRLGKYVNEDGSVTPASQETVEIRGQQRYLETCGFCVKKYQDQDRKFVRENLSKLSKAFKADDLPDGESDHKDFSLN